MKDKAKKYTKLFSKAMKKLGRSVYKQLENVFYQRYTAHQKSEMYQKYRNNYPSIGTDNVYIGITFAQIIKRTSSSFKMIPHCLQQNLRSALQRMRKNLQNAVHI